MNSVTINILDPKQKNLIMALLETFREQKVISFKTEQVNFVLPGEPMTQEELDREIDEAEKSGTLSYEEFKKGIIIKEKKENFAIPGEPMTHEELNEQLENAMKGKKLSYEEVEKHFEF